jgi:PAS domain S-box-containing protein
MEDTPGTTGGRRAVAEGVEFYHVIAALLPLPAFAFGPNGELLVANEAATPLLVTLPDGTRRRPMTFDGMDLWELLSSTLERGRQRASIHTRMRLSTGRSAEFDFWVLASWKPEDTLVGAIVFAGELPDEPEGGSATHPLRAAHLTGDALEGYADLLESTLDCDAVYVAEVESERATRARMLLCRCDGGADHDVEWSLIGKPASAVSSKRVVCYPYGLHERFPEDDWVSTEGFEAYAGVPITDPSGRRIGILAVLWRRPLKDPQTARAVLGLIGARLSPGLWQIRSRRELMESEERYSALFRHTHLPMIVIDPESSQIVEANDAACTFYGYPCEELTTMSIYQIDTLAPEHVQSELRRAIDGTRDYFQFKHRVADGGVREVELYAGPITMHGREMIYAIVHDVSDRRRAEEELEHYRQNLERLVEQRTDDLVRANAELQEATQARDVFFANMSHELRTPLYTIIGLTDMLLGGLVGEIDEEQTKQVGMVNEAGRSLLDLISDVLDISAVQAGQARCEADSFDVVELAESTLFSMRPPAEEKGIEVHFTSALRPVNIVSDRFKLQQILMNLISNAIKYTAEGAIYVSVSAIADGFVTVSVVDSGIGIPAAELPYVFQEFRQMSRGDSGTHRGTGLGLALSRKLADVLSAEIVVTSEQGRGTTFSLILPETCPTSEPLA